MTNELEKRPIEANGRGLMLRSMDDMWRFAGAIVESGLAPDSVKTREQALVILQAGAELGLTPFRSLQSIAVIHGRACLWGDSMMALAQSSPNCEYIKEWLVGENEDMVAWCESKRKGAKEPITTTFSVHDARVAGLWGKTGPWKQYPKRMLQMRARGFNLRNNFADALCGFHAVEEFEGVPMEPAHEPDTPKRAERRQVEAVEVGDENQLQQEAIADVFRTYAKQADNPSARGFAALVNEVCGDSAVPYMDGDNLNPEAYTTDKLQQVTEHLKEQKCQTTKRSKTSSAKKQQSKESEESLLPTEAA